MLWAGRAGTLGLWLSCQFQEKRGLRNSRRRGEEPAPTAPASESPRRMSQHQEVSNCLSRPADDSPTAKDRIRKRGQADCQAEGYFPPNLGMIDYLPSPSAQDLPGQQRERRTEEGLASFLHLALHLRPVSFSLLKVFAPGIARTLFALSTYFFQTHFINPSEDFAYFLNTKDLYL